MKLATLPANSRFSGKHGYLKFDSAYHTEAVVQTHTVPPSSLASSIYEGVHIHIFMSTDRKNNRIQTTLIMQNRHPQLSIFLDRLYGHLFTQDIRVLDHWTLSVV